MNYFDIRTINLKASRERVKYSAMLPHHQFDNVAFKFAQIEYEKMLKMCSRRTHFFKKCKVETVFFKRSWVRIPVSYTGWTYFHIDLLLKNCIVCLKRPKINAKRGRG